MVVESTRWPVADGGPIPGLDPKLKFLLRVETPRPVDTNQAFTATMQIQSNRYVRVWQPRPFTPDERKQNRANREIERAQNQRAFLVNMLKIYRAHRSDPNATGQAFNNRQRDDILAAMIRLGLNISSED